MFIVVSLLNDVVQIEKHLPHVCMRVCCYCCYSGWSDLFSCFYEDRGRDMWYVGAYVMIQFQQVTIRRKKTE